MNYLIFISGISLGAILSHWWRKKRKRLRLNGIRERERYLKEKKELWKKIKADKLKHGYGWHPDGQTLRIWEETDKFMAMNPDEQKAYKQERERKTQELWQEARKKELKKLDRGDNIPLTPKEKKRKIMIEEAIERNK